MSFNRTASSARLIEASVVNVERIVVFISHAQFRQERLHGVFLPIRLRPANSTWPRYPTAHFKSAVHAPSASGHSVLAARRSRPSSSMISQNSQVNGQPRENCTPMCEVVLELADRDTAWIARAIDVADHGKSLVASTLAAISCDDALGSHETRLAAPSAGLM